MENAMVPAQIPAYALTQATAEGFAGMFDDLLYGVSTGAPPSLRCKQGRFRTVTNGTETPITPKELVDGEYLPIIILGAKRAFNKAYFAKAYDPNQEAEGPDCFSYDGERPDASVAAPVCTVCASCPMNAFGSGRNQNGAPTDGKACADSKILAVLYRGEVYQFKIPPSSLKPFGLYIKTLMGRNVSPGNVVTYLSVDQSSEFQKFAFKVGAFVPEEKLPGLAELATSAEVADIIRPPVGVGSSKKHQAPATPAAPAPMESPAPAAPAPEEAKAKPRAKKEQPAVSDADLPPVAPAQAAAKATAVPTDDELANLLGF